MPQLKSGVMARVINGESILPNQVPYQIEVIRNIDGNDTHWCGGTLVSPKFVVTAKHCLFNKIKNPFTEKLVRVEPIPHQEIVLLAGGYRHNDINAQVRYVY